MIVKVAGFPVEIQVRTPLQNNWAQATESLSDSFDPEIKYGGGPKKLHAVLELMSTKLERNEHLETDLIRLRETVIELRETVKGGSLLEEVSSLETDLMKVRKQLLGVLERIMMAAEKKV